LLRTGRLTFGALDIDPPRIMPHITNGSKRPIETIYVKGVLT